MSGSQPMGSFKTLNSSYLEVVKRIATSYPDVMMPGLNWRALNLLASVG
jgi:hypothetical protein